MTQYAHTEYGTSEYASTGEVNPEAWRVIRDGVDGEPNLFDLSVVDTANPFGSYAVAYIDDPEGTRFDVYSRGTRVEFRYRDDSGNYQTRFVGFVVERRTTEEQGTDTLEVECYTFDQFLRRGTVSVDTSGKTISTVLEQIINRDTPADYVAGNIEVGEDVELTRNYRGENVENALRSLANKSVNEEFGVNDSIEFYWRPSESSNAPKDLGDPDIFAYDIPERGKRAINEVTVFYDGGEKSVTVDNGEDKAQLQSNIGSSDPVTFSEEIHRDSITNLSDAQDAGERYLENREPLLTGTVTTFGLYAARPGDVINIQYTQRGLDTEFRIAELEYLWGRAETRLTIVEKRGQQDDLLVNLSDSVKRLGERGTNRDGESNRVTSTDVGVLVDSALDVDGVGESSSRVVNTGRNKLQDAWAGDGPVQVTELAVGDDASAPKRSQDSLGNELERVSVTESLPDAYTAEYSADFSTENIREVGLFDFGGDMIARATIPDSSLSSPVTVAYTFTTDNDPDRGGVVTNAGQTAVRDSLADNNPSTPVDYAYGDDGTTPTESDTALGNELVRVPIDELLVQSADSESTWNGITSIADDVPASVDASGSLDVEQIAWTTEGENYTSGQEFRTTDPNNLSDFSGGDGVYLSRGPGATGGPDFAEWEFTPQHDIPGSRVEFEVRTTTAQFNSPAFEWTLVEPGGTSHLIDEITTYDSYSESLGWHDIGDGVYSASDPTLPDLTGGETYTLRVEVTDSNGTADNVYYYVDVVAPFDEDYEGQLTFDDTNGGSSGYLDGPELYPSGELVSFSSTSTTRAFDSARVSQTWNDTSNNQFIELSNDGGSTWQTLNNTDSGSVTFSSAETTLQARVNLSRYGSRTTATPQTGYQGQSVSTHDLYADIIAISPEDNGLASVNAIVNVQDENLVGEVVREAGEFAESGELLARSVFPEVDLLSTGPTRLLSSEDFRWTNPD